MPLYSIFNMFLSLIVVNVYVWLCAGLWVVITRDSGPLILASLLYTCITHEHLIVHNLWGKSFAQHTSTGVRVSQSSNVFVESFRLVVTLARSA